MKKEKIPALEKTVFSQQAETPVGCCADVKTTAQTPCCSASKTEASFEKAAENACCTPETKGQPGCC
jgi:hypothetical protein